jgi:phytoene dehydrogenase-like protein
MGRRAAEIQARQRRPRAEAPVPHLVGQALALEDVASRETHARLDVRRSEHLTGDDALRDVGRVPGNQSEHRVADVFALGVPPALELVRGVLREDAHRPGARRCHGWVVRGLEVELTPGRRGVPGTGSGAGHLGLVDARGDLDLGAVHRLRAGRRERREPRQRAVHFHDRAVGAPLPDAGAKRRRHVSFDECKGSLGVGVRDDGPRAHGLTVVEAYALPRGDADHFRVGADGDAGLASRLGKALRDPSHAALDVAPTAEEAEAVMGVDPRSAGIARPGEGPDDPLSVEGGAQSRVAHVSLDDVGDGRVQYDVERFRVVGEELLELGTVGRVADPGVAGPLAQHRTDAVEERVVGEETSDVARRERFDLTRRSRRVAPLRERRAVVERRPLRRVAHEGPVAVACEVQLRDHERVQQTDEVRARAHHEARIGKGPFRRAGAAEPGPALEDQHGAAGTTEVRGGGQPVVSAADDHHVPRASRRLLHAIAADHGLRTYRARDGSGTVGRVQPDAVVIGAGPNGLVAANLLADAGWKVLVLEAQPEPGGAVRSAELTHPGFVHDVFSAFYPLGMSSPVMKSLDLTTYGLRWRRAPLVLAHPTADGRCAVLSTAVGETAQSLEEYARKDGDAWRDVYASYERIADPLMTAMITPFPPVRGATRLALTLGPRGALEFARTALLSVRRLGEEQFDGEGGALLVAGNALHSDVDPDAPPSGFLGWFLTCLGQQHGFPVPEGGAGQLTAALVCRLEARGGELRCSSRVKRVVVRGKRAVGVEVASGETIDAPLGVIADTAAPALYRSLVGEEHLSPRFVRAIDNFEWDHGTFKIDWALSGSIPWRVEAARDAGTVHLCDSMERVIAYSADLGRGLIPAHPFVLIGQMNKADPTRSPPGTETVWAYTHVPHEPRGDAAGELTGTWSAADAERFADRLEAVIEEHAPGFRALITARHLLAPPALEALDANLVGGALGGGTMAFSQQLVFRPVPGLGRAETPVRGLFLASASAHPGGGVHGACGANAARAALFADRVRGMTRRARAR